MENCKNQDLEGKKELLVVSFGTTFAETREKTIGAIEDALGAMFPDWAVRRAFTSRFILKRLRERDGLVMDGIEEALERAVRCGVKELIIQPTHLMTGKEFEKIERAVEAHRDSFGYLAMGRPLLADEDDLMCFCGILAAEALDYSDAFSEDTAFVHMGHGTDAVSDEVYERLQSRMHESGLANHYVATVEGAVSIADVVGQLRGRAYRRVVLLPLMIVAGDHAVHDMAGDQEDSWKQILLKEGYQVETDLRGLGQLPGVHRMFASHVEAVLPKR